MSFNLKPFYLCFFIYLFANIIFLIISLANGNIVNIEFMSFYIETDVLIKALAIQVLALLIIWLIYIFFSKKKYKDNFIFPNSYGYFLIFWQILFIIFAIFLGLGVVGSDKVVNPNLVRLSNFISADVLYFILAPSLKSKKLYVLNTILYLISTIVRGWLGGILIAFFIYCCRKNILKISLKSFFIVVSVVVMIFFISPFLIDLKFLIRNDEEIVLSTDDYIIRLSLALDYLLGRFQHLGHTALLINSADFYKRLYEQSIILPYWLEGIPQNFLYKIIGNDKLFTFSQNFAIWDFNANSSAPWYSNTGVSGWLIILREKSIFFLMYWLSIISLVFLFLLKYANRQTFNMISVFMIVFLYHGWLGSFFNLIFLTIIIFIIKRIKV